MNTFKQFKTFKPFKPFELNAPHLFPPPRPRGRMKKGV
jgi:hypothetical protein